MNAEAAKSSGELGYPEQFHTEIEDNKGLGAWPGPQKVGSVLEVNGPDAREFSEYSPSHYELEVLARHWQKTALDIELEWFFLATTGSTEIRLGPYARRRLARIAQTIGDDAVDEVIEQVNQEARDRLGEDDWRTFVEGDESARQKLLEEAHGL